MSNFNLILDTDSYKASHYLQYPPGTEYAKFYLESRGGKYSETVFFGLQYIIKKYLIGKVITQEDIDDAELIFREHGEPFNKDGWEYILRQYEGKLPLRIKAIPEGTVVPIGNALLTVEVTDPKVFWLGSYVETLLMRVWYPITVATQSYELKKLIYRYLKETSDDPAGEIGFKLHDFGSRGVSSFESAGIGGLSHLVSFKGTDTVAALSIGRQFYNCPMAGFSIPAAEHSTITAWGKDREVDAYRNMLKQFAKPGSVVAVVSDSYNVYSAAARLWGEELKDEIVASGATVVIRPDSGDPVAVVANLLDILEDKFGVTTNTKGYKVLNHVRLIQGDGVNPASIEEILKSMKYNSFSATNIAFGMGGALLQKVDRDTQKMAYKCCLLKVNGKTVPVSKDPITDPGKKSKEGNLTLVENILPGIFKTVDLDTFVSKADKDALIPVFENGELLQSTTFADVRARVDSWFPYEK